MKSTVFELPGVDDVASSGAAAESAEWNEKLQRLPRILRYAVLGKRRKTYLRERLVAEIAELAPGLMQTVRWVYKDDSGHGLALAAELDQLAVTRDRPDLRSLADCVRLLSLPLPGAPAQDQDHRRVAKALAQAASQLLRPSTSSSPPRLKPSALAGPSCRRRWMP